MGAIHLTLVPLLVFLSFMVGHAVGYSRGETNGKSSENERWAAVTRKLTSEIVDAWQADQNRLIAAWKADAASIFAAWKGQFGKG